LAGGIAGLLGGGIGGGKSVGPNGGTNIGVSGNQLVLGTSGADNGADVAATIAEAQKLIQSVNQLTQSYGLGLGNLPRDENGRFMVYQGDINAHLPRSAGELLQQ